MSIELNEPERRGFGMLLDRCRRWSEEHKAEVGVAEMALGAAAIAWGVQNGTVILGAGVVGTKVWNWGMAGGATGVAAGGIGSAILGSIGIAGAYTFGVPAVILGLGGMAILGAAGYGIGNAAHSLLTPTPGWADLLTCGSLLHVGVALIIHGARRVATDERVLQRASRFVDGVIELATLSAEVVAKTREELAVFIENLAQDPATAATLGTTTVAGLGIGGAIAASSVSVLGSHGLGAVALSLGLVAAPIWPVILCGAAGLVCGVAVWKGGALHCRRGFR